MYYGIVTFVFDESDIERSQLPNKRGLHLRCGVIVNSEKKSHPFTRLIV